MSWLKNRSPLARLGRSLPGPGALDASGDGFRADFEYSAPVAPVSPTIARPARSLLQTLAGVLNPT